MLNGCCRGWGIREGGGFRGRRMEADLEDGGGAPKGQEREAHAQLAQACPHLFTPAHACHSHATIWHHFLSSSLTRLAFPTSLKALVLTSFSASSQRCISFREVSPSSPVWVACPGHPPAVPSSSLGNLLTADACWAGARRG